MSFVAELKRRHVYRVAILYIIVSWLVLQVADVFMSFLPLPEWTANLIFLLLVLGFPISLVFAWAFELTPQGLQRDRRSVTDHQIEAPRTAATGKTLNVMIISAMALIIAYLAFTHEWRDDAGIVKQGEILSIVVLPLENLMNDPEQAYFVEGMHEALIIELSKITALSVISRTSALHYMNSGKTVPEIAQELGVDAVVEGSVLKAGNKVRITAKLIEGSTDRHLWADHFDRELTDILALYADVTREIANQIKITVTPEEQAKLVVSRQVNPEVYELYLKGRYQCYKWSPLEMQQGVELMQQAISLDTQHAPSYAGLARCLQYSAFFGYVRPEDISTRSKAAALMAVELDDGLAEAYVALAGVLYYLEYNASAAEKQLIKALELEPANFDALIHLSWLLGETNRFEEALGPTLRAIELDPFSIVAHQAMGQIQYLHGDFDQAILAFEKALDLDRKDSSIYQFMAWPLEQIGEYERAIALHKSAVEFSQGAPLYLSGLGYSYGMAGMDDMAMQILEELRQAEHPSAYNLAIVHLGLGNYERAIDLLEVAFEARNSYVLAYLNKAAQFDPLRDNERFRILINRINK